MKEELYCLIMLQIWYNIYYIFTAHEDDTVSDICLCHLGVICNLL